MSKETKMTTCKSCGAEIAKSAKTCPKCGAKNKKPIYKRTWFIILAVIVVIMAFQGLSGGEGSKPATTDSEKVQIEDKEQEAKEITYTEYLADDMKKELDENALKATEKYKGQYVAIVGKLKNIDSDGKYISIASINDNWDFKNTICYIKNDEQKQTIMDLSTGDNIIVKGKITQVGEVLGYSMDIDEIQKK